MVGPYSGDGLSVDHIVPRAVVPELDNVIANLELMSLKLNLNENNKVGNRQVSHAEKLHTAGLLSREGLEKLNLVANKGSAALRARDKICRRDPMPLEIDSLESRS